MAQKGKQASKQQQKNPLRSNRAVLKASYNTNILTKEEVFSPLMFWIKAVKPSPTLPIPDASAQKTRSPGPIRLSEQELPINRNESQEICSCSKLIFYNPTTVKSHNL